MKILSITIVLFLSVLQAANAQNQKGNQTLGLGVQFGANSGNYNYLGGNPASLDYATSTSTYFSTNPSYSYFVANNLDAGVSIGFGSGTSNYNDHTMNQLTKQVEKNYYGSVYLRKYFLYNNKIGIRTGPYIAYQYFNSNYVYTPNNSQPNYYASGSNYHAGLTADFVYYPASKIGLAVNIGSLSYNYGKTSSPQQSMSDNGISLQFLNNGLMLSAFYVIGN